MASLLAQTMTDWELIISDNYSDDGSWEFFQKFKGDPRITMFQSPRAGMYANWNECLKVAKGCYIYVATSDDTAQPACLERLVEPLERRPDIQVAVCDFQRIDAEGRHLADDLRLAEIRGYLGEWLDVPSIRDGRAEFVVHACVGTTWHTMTSVLFRRTLLGRIGFFRTDRASHGDEEWCLRAHLLTDTAYVPGRLATWRYYEGQGTPHVSRPRGSKIVLDCLETVLRDDKAGIPEAWKQIPDWDKRLAAVRRADYLASFRLWRHNAVGHPGLFFSGVRAAWQAERQLLLRQLSRGFAWSDDFQTDRAKAATSLLQDFHAAWPPKRVKGGW